MAEVLGDRDAAVVREISKTFEETVTGRLSELSARYVDAPPKGEIVVVVAPPGEAPPPSQEDSDAAPREAMERLPVSKAAGEVAKALGLDRRALYARAMILKSEVYAVSKTKRAGDGRRRLAHCGCVFGAGELWTAGRSEERRLGRECVSRGRCRWWTSD